MCTHDFFVIDSYPTCVLCGLVKPDRYLDDSITAWGHSVHADKKVTRAQRFARLCKNLRGFQNIPDEVLEECQHFTTLPELKAHLKATNPKLLKKLPSIWRQTGHLFRGPTEEELERLKFLFNAQSKSRSFLVTLPKLLIEIGRQDLLQFIKIPSRAVQKKHDCLL